MVNSLQGLAFVRQKRPFVCHALRVFANTLPARNRDLECKVIWSTPSKVWHSFVRKDRLSVMRCACSPTHGEVLAMLTSKKKECSSDLSNWLAFHKCQRPQGSKPMPKPARQMSLKKPIAESFSGEDNCSQRCMFALFMRGNSEAGFTQWWWTPATQLSSFFPIQNIKLHRNSTFVGTISPQWLSKYQSNDLTWNLLARVHVESCVMTSQPKIFPRIVIACSPLQRTTK